jgi:hypothetical protein
MGLLEKIFGSEEERSVFKIMFDKLSGCEEEEKISREPC